ncbi:hypothetical protein COU57_03355 [Candidatus Pacearchaeota archaeon CG10_big_fil_rev_8_21_14_0_10_32_14]|nr:MAG: hypothetical protein COU57_03355 [Candidatus Pacearchaeota archaeon CG10_big_fil_rev_8_21_14_0_10_32_14]
MGILSKLKDLFTKNQTPDSKDNLISADSESLKKDIYDINEKLKIDYILLNKNLQKILNNLKDDAEVLKKVNLEEKKVESRIRDANETARKDYLFSLEKLIENLRQEKEGDEMFTFTSSELNKFHNQTKKSYQYASLIIGEEMKKIKDRIKEIEKLEADFIEKNRSNLIKKQNLTQLIVKYNEKEKLASKYNEIKNQISEFELSCDNIKKQIMSLQKNLDEKKSSTGYKKRLETQKELQDKKDSLRSLELTISVFFDKKLLERYLQIESNKEIISLVQEYLLNPALALQNDSNLIIIEIFQNISEKLKDGSFNFKDLDKAIDKAKINRQMVLDYHHRLKKYKSEIKIFEDELSKNDGLEYEINEINDKEESIKKINTEISSLRKKANKLDLEVKDKDEDIASMQKN